MAWGGFLDKLISKLPIQGRVERWKNSKAQLEAERAELLKGQCDSKKADRIVVINRKLDELVRLLENKAGD